MTQEIERPLQSYDPAAPIIERSEAQDESKRTSRYPITEAEYSGLQQAYGFMNTALFGGELPNSMLRQKRSQHNTDQRASRGSFPIKPHMRSVTRLPKSYSAYSDKGSYFRDVRTACFGHLVPESLGS